MSTMLGTKTSPVARPQVPWPSTYTQAAAVEALKVSATKCHSARSAEARKCLSPAPPCMAAATTTTTFTIYNYYYYSYYYYNCNYYYYYYTETHSLRKATAPLTKASRKALRNPANDTIL
jgi:hypothetical protein